MENESDQSEASYYKQARPSYVRANIKVPNYFRNMTVRVLLAHWTDLH